MVATTRFVMTVFELLSDYVQPATLDDSVGDALALALGQGYQLVPVVDEDEVLVATTRLPELVACPDPERPLREHRLNSPIFVASEAHTFDAIELALDNEVDLLPVIDESGRYLGSVDLSGLLRSAARTLGLGTAGANIEVDISPRDYALARLVHTIEENGAKVLSVNTERLPETESDVRVTVKVSVPDPVRIRAVLEHYGYQVVAVDRRKSTAEDIQQRVREFMHYLDV